MKKISILIFLIGIVACSVPQESLNIYEETKKKINWRIIANADIIVEGVLYAPISTIEEIQRSGEDEYIELKINDINYLKSKDLNNSIIKIKFHTKENEHTLNYKISMNRLKRLNGKRVIAYLRFTQAGMGVKPALYLLNSIDALTNNLNKKEVIHEIALEKSYTKEQIKKYYNDEELYNKVKRLIKKMLHKESIYQAYADLEKLGEIATPYIIIQMDDYRELDEKRVSFYNKSVSAFEGTVHYSPKKVVDILSIFLNFMNDEAFYVELANGGSHLNRENAVKAWIVWLYKRNSKL